MITHYHTADVQQEIKDQLNAMFQELEEDPLTFYTRIRHMIFLAGYADAVRDQVAETTFMNGLHKEIAMAIRSSPTVLDLQQKVDYAHRYWIARNPNKNVILPEKLCTTVRKYDPKPTTPQNEYASPALRSPPCQKKTSTNLPRNSPT